MRKAQRRRTARKRYRATKFCRGEACAPESFSLSAEKNKVVRTVHLLRKTGVSRTSLKVHVPVRDAHTSDQDKLAAIFDQAFLTQPKFPPTGSVGRIVRIADLFSSCGFMSLGVHEACRALNLRMQPVLAVDVSEVALNVYSENFCGALTLQCSVSELLDRPFGSSLSKAEKRLRDQVGALELVVAGPPCQGHSNLNNITRRRDPKNELYERVARFAELVRPKHLIIENVPEVLYDNADVVDRTFQELLCLGYFSDHAVVDLGEIGVPQRRKRHVLIASLNRDISIKDVVTVYRRPRRSVQWAISDLKRAADSAAKDFRNIPACASKRSQERMAYLLAENLFDLPNDMRPDCHRLVAHSYKSVYGRLRWNAPAQTITSGFTCMGQGRYVHPKHARTLTPHEAARLQFIPSFFAFDSVPTRTELSEMIGNAVPVKLTYILALELLR